MNEIFYAKKGGQYAKMSFGNDRFNVRYFCKLQNSFLHFQFQKRYNVVENIDKSANI